jgi:hypothetical protein
VDGSKAVEVVACGMWHGCQVAPLLARLTDQDFSFVRGVALLIETHGRISWLISRLKHHRMKAGRQNINSQVCFWVRGPIWDPLEPTRCTEHSRLELTTFGDRTEACAKTRARTLTGATRRFS